MRSGKAKLPGLGVFAGAGYGSAGRVQAVVALGLCGGCGKKPSIMRAISLFFFSG